MTNVQAGIGLAQVARIEDHVAQKRRMAALYNERLGKIAGLQSSGRAARLQERLLDVWRRAR